MKRTFSKAILLGIINLIAFSSLVGTLYSLLEAPVFWEVFIPFLIIFSANLATLLAVVFISSELSQMRKNKTGDSLKTEGQGDDTG